MIVSLLWFNIGTKANFIIYSNKTIWLVVCGRVRKVSDRAFERNVSHIYNCYMFKNID